MIRKIIRKIISNFYRELMESVRTDNDEGITRKEYYRQQMERWIS